MCIQIDSRCVLFNILQANDSADLSDLKKFAVAFKAANHGAYVDISDASVYSTLEGNPDIFTLDGRTVRFADDPGLFKNEEFLDKTVNRSFPPEVRQSLHACSTGIEAGRRARSITMRKLTDPEILTRFLAICEKHGQTVADVATPWLADTYGPTWRESLHFERGEWWIHSFEEGDVSGDPSVGVWGAIPSYHAAALLLRVIQDVLDEAGIEVHHSGRPSAMLAAYDAMMTPSGREGE